MADYIPGREPELVTWASDFAANVAAIGPAAIGLTPAQQTDLQAKVDDFVAAYGVATNMATRTRPAIQTKDLLKRQMVQTIRQLAGVIQKHPGTTDAQRAQLGLTIPAERQSVGIPGEAPDMDIVSVIGRVVRSRVHSAQSASRRGKPPYCIGCVVYSYVGATPPTDPAEWRHEGMTTKTTFDVTFPDSVPNGSTVFLTARWVNEKLQAGPSCEPVSTILQGGAAQAA